MKTLFPLLLAAGTLAGCSKSSPSSSEAVPARQSPPDNPAEPELGMTFAQICELIDEETYPETERVKLGKMLHDQKVSWEGLVRGPASYDDFLLVPDRTTTNGVIFIPPREWIKDLFNRPRFTPIRVTGRLDYGYHGLRLHATTIELLSAPDATTPSTQ